MTWEQIKNALRHINCEQAAAEIGCAPKTLRGVKSGLIYPDSIKIKQAIEMYITSLANGGGHAPDVFNAMGLHIPTSSKDAP